MTSQTSNQKLKILKLPSQEEFEPSNPSPINPSSEIHTPSHNLAFDSCPSALLFSNKNRIFVNNYNLSETTARFNEESPQNRRTSFSIAMRQRRTSRRLRNGGLNTSYNGEPSGFTEAIAGDVSSAGFKQEGLEMTSVATPTSGASLYKRTSKRKSFQKNGNSNMSIMNPFATEEDEEEIDIFEDKKEVEKEKRKSRGKIIVEKILKSMMTNIIVGIVTVFALFGDDVRTLVNSEVLNWVLDVIALVTFIVFVVEIGFALYVEEGYLGSVFFWLDIFSTASLIFDFEFLIEDVMPHQ